MSYIIHNKKTNTKAFLEIDAINEFDRQLRDLYYEYKRKYPRADKAYIMGKVLYYLWVEQTFYDKKPSEDITVKFMPYVARIEVSSVDILISRKMSSNRNKKLTGQWYNKHNEELEEKEYVKEIIASKTSKVSEAV